MVTTLSLHVICINASMCWKKFVNETSFLQSSESHSRSLIIRCSIVTFGAIKNVPFIQVIRGCRILFTMSSHRNEKSALTDSMWSKEPIWDLVRMNRTTTYIEALNQHLRVKDCLTCWTDPLKSSEFVFPDSTTVNNRFVFSNLEIQIQMQSRFKILQFFKESITRRKILLH